MFTAKVDGTTVVEQSPTTSPKQSSLNFSSILSEGQSYLKNAITPASKSQGSTSTGLGASINGILSQVESDSKLPINISSVLKIVNSNMPSSTAGGSQPVISHPISAADFVHIVWKFSLLPSLLFLWLVLSLILR